MPKIPFDTSAKKTAVGRYSSFFLKVRSIIISIYDYRCVICNKETLNLEVHHCDHDHTNDDPFNLKPVCPQCHQLIQNFASVLYPALKASQNRALMRLQQIVSKSYF